MAEQTLENIGEFVDQAAKVVELPIPSEYRQGVVENFERIVAIAHLVTDFPLPKDIEIAPVFEP